MQVQFRVNGFARIDRLDAQHIAAACLQVPVHGKVGIPGSAHHKLLVCVIQEGLDRRICMTGVDAEIAVGFRCNQAEDGFVLPALNLLCRVFRKGRKG